MLLMQLAFNEIRVGQTFCRDGAETLFAALCHTSPLYEARVRYWFMPRGATAPRRPMEKRRRGDRRSSSRPRRRCELTAVSGNMIVRRLESASVAVLRASNPQEPS